MYGWMGVILRVDLTSGRIEKEPLSKELQCNYLGGRGINVRILYNEIKRSINGLDPNNILIFGTGPLTGTMLPASRLNITAISPLTNMLGDSNGGSHFSPELKYAGYDHIVFTGKADKPVYLWIENDEVELMDASTLWGKSTEDTNRIIKEKFGDPRIQLACIGPAGENLVNLAGVAIGTDGFVGRFGMGAVMGSKNLKAVAVRGTKGVQVAEPDVFRALALDLKCRTMQHVLYPGFSKYGTTINLSTRNTRGDIAYRNAQQTGHWNNGYAEIGPDTLYNKYTIKNKACLGCVTHCRRWYEVKEGPYAGLKGVGIEYETQQTWGAINDNSYAPSLYKGFELCNQYGLDQGAVAQLIAAATEWYEKGILTKEDTQGIELAWGNYEGMMEIVRKIAYREGIGDLLAQGAVYVAKKLGKEAEKCITHVKGIMRTEGDIRGTIAYLFGLAVATRGFDHLRGADARYAFHKYEGAVTAVYTNQIVTTLADALEVCKFNTTYKLGMSIKDMAELFSAATGNRVSEKEFKDVADRIWSLEKSMIIREGMSREDDILVGRYMDEPVHGGPFDGMRVDRDKYNMMLNEYYELNGWDKETGIPTRATLERLGLQDAADELESLRI